MSPSTRAFVFVLAAAAAGPDSPETPSGRGIGAGVAAHAQAPAGPQAPKPGAAIQKPPDRPPIRVRVALVNAPVTVRDAKGELVLDLIQQDFRVYDNGVEQQLDAFDLGGDQRSLVLVFQASSRVEGLLPGVRKAGILFGQTVVGQSGEAAVLAFDDTTKQLLPFTSNLEQIEKTIERLPGGNSGSHLYDAMSSGIGMLRERPPERRRVMVVVSEAVDTGSETKLGEVLREAQLENVTIYSVGLSSLAAELKAPPKETVPIQPTPPGTFGLPPIPGTVQTPTTEQHRYGNVNLLNVIALLVRTGANAARENSLELAAAATGGGNFSTGWRERSIESAINQIGNELSSQYLLAYRPAGVDPAGYHEIKVEVQRRGMQVRSRPGYYLPAENK